MTDGIIARTGPGRQSDRHVQLALYSLYNGQGPSPFYCLTEIYQLNAEKVNNQCLEFCCFANKVNFKWENVIKR